MSISRLSAILRGLSVFLGVFALVTVGAEGVFRLLGDRSSADLEGLYAPFGNRSYKLGSNVDTGASWAAGPWSVTTDALGLRCDTERILAAREGEHLDVLILGDSQGFGHGVDFERSLAGATAMLASASGKKVANASVGGHGAGNQFEIAEWLATDMGIRADHVVYLCTPNVVRYPASYASLVVGEDGRLYSKELTGLQAWRASLESAAKRRTVIYGRFRDAVRNLNIGTKPAEEGDHMVGLYATDGDPEEAVAATAAFTGKLRAVAEKLGGKAHVVYVPLTVEVEFQGIADQAALAGRSVDVDGPASILAQAAAEVGIGSFSLKPSLEEAQAEGLPLRLRADFHYSTEVSVLCAGDLWGYLEESAGLRQ